MNEIECQSKPHQKEKQMTVLMTSGFLTAGLILTLVCLVSACCYRLRWKKRREIVRINKDEEMQLTNGTVHLLQGITALININFIQNHTGTMHSFYLLMRTHDL